MMNNYKSLAALLFLTGSIMVGGVVADDEVMDELLSLYGSEEFISIATGYRQPVSKAPAVASIIDSREIRNSGATDIDEVLALVPGLHVSRNHQGYNPVYTFRGIYSDFNPQVLMLVNGIPLTNVFTGNRSNSWLGMPVEAIQRIEVIRGPGSAIYGADAFAGVINIITKSGGDIDGLEVGGRHGTYDTTDFFSSYGKVWDRSSLGFVVEASHTNGSDRKIGADAQSYLDAITGTNASLAPGSLNLQRESLDMRLDYRLDNLVIRAGYQGRFNAGTGAGVVQALDDNNEFKSERISADVSYAIEEILPDLSANLSASFLHTSQEVEGNLLLFPRGSTGSFLGENGQPLFGVFDEGVVGNPEVYERHTRVNATFHYTGLDNHDLSLGMGYYHGDLYKVRESKNYCTDQESCDFILGQGGVVDVSDTPHVFLRESDRRNYYAYVQDVFKLANDWELTAGLRYDHYSDFGETINPRLALVWSTFNRLTTKLLYGEAFRAPAFSETRNINNPAALGNPDLDPETLRSFELVFDYKPFYELNTIFNTFYYEWDDIIQFVPGPEGNTARNAGQQTGYGFELETRWNPSTHFSISANYAWQKSTNKRTNRNAANAPQRQFYIQSNWSFSPDYHLNVQGSWVMDRPREAEDPRRSIDDYILVDVTLRKSRFWRSLDAALIVKNIFNEDAREPSLNGVPVPLIPNDLPLPGRRIIGEISYRF